VPAIKTVFMSLLVLITIITVTFQCLVSPVIQKKYALDKKENLLKMLQRKSDQITDILQRNTKYSLRLRDNIQANVSLNFLQQQLSLSRLFVESMKITPAEKYDDIHLILRGKYRHLLEFFKLLAEQPNGMRVMTLVLKKNQMIIHIRANKIEKSATLPGRHHQGLDMMQRLKRDLVFVKPPILFMPHHDLPRDVQSPFISRKLSAVASHSLQSLARYDWSYVGDVHQAGNLLGVFLEAQGKAQYFGLGLSWQNSDWMVVDIGSRAVFFQHKRSQEHWQLSYTQKQRMNECLPKACIK
jgi:hypothetical protein